MIFPHLLRLTVRYSVWQQTRRVPPFLTSQAGYPLGKPAVLIPCVVTNINSEADAFLTGNILSQSRNNTETIDTIYQVRCPTREYKKKIKELTEGFYSSRVLRPSELPPALARWNTALDNARINGQALSDEVKERHRLLSGAFAVYSENLDANFRNAHRFLETPGGFSYLSILWVSDLAASFSQGRQRSSANFGNLTFSDTELSAISGRIRLARTAEDVTRLIIGVTSRYLP